MKYAVCILAVALLSVACDARDTLKKSTPSQEALPKDHHSKKSGVLSHVKLTEPDVKPQIQNTVKTFLEKFGDYRHYDCIDVDTLTRRDSGTDYYDCTCASDCTGELDCASNCMGDLSCSSVWYEMYRFTSKISSLYLPNKYMLLGTVKVIQENNQDVLVEKSFELIQMKKMNN
jgi:hypothetical protein